MINSSRVIVMDNSLFTFLLTKKLTTGLSNMAIITEKTRGIIMS